MQTNRQGNNSTINLHDIPAGILAMVFAVALSSCGRQSGDEPTMLPDSLRFDRVTGRASLFDGRTMGYWSITDFSRHGDVHIEDNSIRMEKGNDMTGVTWAGPLIKMDYEIELEAMRLEGKDFFCGLTFPVGDDCCSFVCGGWGGTVCGLSTINYYDAANNATFTTKDFKTGRWYHIRVRVTQGRIQAWIDEERLVNIRTIGQKIGVRFEMEPSQPLGIATWQTTGAARNITVRKINPELEPETEEIDEFGDVFR